MNLLVPQFTPAPIEQPNIPIHLAALNPYMCQVADEVADGIRPHPVCTAKYIEEVMLPAVRKEAARTSRKIDSFAVCIKPLIATAPDRTELEMAMENVRARVAFYASTPAYVTAFEAHGFGVLAQKLATYSCARRWGEMSKLISDEMLHTWDEIAGKLDAGYASVATNIEFSIPVRSTKDHAQLIKLVERLRRM